MEARTEIQRIGSIGSTQLRFEGIDALELHFEGHHPPRPLADGSRDYLTGLLDMNPVASKPPQNVTVNPPVAHDGTRGYILSRALEAHGRPVSFALAGDPASNDGDTVTLRAPLLHKSGGGVQTTPRGNASRVEDRMTRSHRPSGEHRPAPRSPYTSLMVEGHPPLANSR